MLRIKLIKSPIGNTKTNRRTVAALGLRKMHHTVYLPDNAAVRGMVHHVKHMLEVAVVDDSEAPKKAQTRKAKSAPKAAVPAPKTAEAPKAQAPEAPAADEAPKAEKPKTAVKPKAAAAPKPKAAPASKTTKKAKE